MPTCLFVRHLPPSLLPCSFSFLPGHLAGKWILSWRHLWGDPQDCWGDQTSENSSKEVSLVAPSIVLLLAPHCVHRETVPHTEAMIVCVQSLTYMGKCTHRKCYCTNPSNLARMLLDANAVTATHIVRLALHMLTYCMFPEHGACLSQLPEVTLLPSLLCHRALHPALSMSVTTSSV